MRCEQRTLDDLRAIGGNSLEDERRFATAKRVSEINLANYRNFVQPWVRAIATPQIVERMRNLHPLRAGYEAFGRDTPAMKSLAAEAETVRENRKPADKENPFLKAQETVSQSIVDVLDKWRDMQEALSESLFLSIYGSPALQAAVGVDPNANPSPRPEMSEQHRKLLDARIAELKSKIGNGGVRECGIRALLYVGMARGMVDERGLEALRRMRREDTASRLTLSEFKTLVREQFFMLLLDQDASLAAIPKMLPQDTDHRRAVFAAIREVLSIGGDISGETAKRLNRVAQLFGVSGEATDGNGSSFSPQAKAS
jgi:hypothetical protein